MTTASTSRPADSSADPAIHRVRDNLSSQNMLVTLGVEIVELARGRVVLDLPVRPAVTQQNGFAHAGAVTTLADAAAGAAALSLMPEGKDVLSVEFKVNLLRPGVGERLRATATVIRSGRTITVVSADVRALDREEADVPALDGGERGHGERNGEERGRGERNGGERGRAEQDGAAVEDGGPGKQVALMQATMIAVDQPQDQ